MLLFDVDFEKAYDLVEWNYLHELMRLMGFCEKRRGRIMKCLRSEAVSVFGQQKPTKGVWS